MSTPLHDHCYALSLALVRHALHAHHVPEDLRMGLHQQGLDIGLTVESAVGASDRFEFEAQLYAINVAIRRIKFTMRLLDDLELMLPEEASTLADMAEQTQRIVLACLRTSKKNGLSDVGRDRIPLR